MVNQRMLLEQYVQEGKLMQVSTICSDGSPALCHVWYAHSFKPDRLYFISRKDRVHSTNIRNTPEVAGGIIAIPLIGLGQVVRGVTFRGRASQLGTEARDELECLIKRWPNASDAITYERLVNGDTLTRLYEISVTEWLLFDEEHFPKSPRRPIPVGE